MRSKYFSAVPVAHPGTVSDRDVRTGYLCRWHRPETDRLAAKSNDASSTTQPPARLTVDPVPLAHPMPWFSCSDGHSFRRRGYHSHLRCEIAYLGSGGVPVAHPAKDPHREDQDPHLCRRHTLVPSDRYTASEARSAKALSATGLSDSKHRAQVFETTCSATWGVPAAHLGKAIHLEDRARYLCRWHRSAALVLTDSDELVVRLPERSALKLPPVPPAHPGWEPGWTTPCNLVREFGNG